MMVFVKESMGNMIQQAISISVCGVLTSMGDSVKTIECKLEGIEMRLDEKVTGKLLFFSLVFFAFNFL